MKSAPTVVRISVPRLYYFLLIVYTINVPGFLRFDRSRLTQTYGLFNAQSISRIILFLACGAVTAWLIAKNGTAPFRNPDLLRALKPVLLTFGVFAISSVVASPQRLLSFYRLAEWGLALTLVAGSLHWYRVAEWPEFAARFAYRISVASVLIVCLVLLLPSNIAYFAEESQRGDRLYRLGGSVIPPTMLGFLAGSAFFYCLLYFRSRRRWLLCSFYFVVLLLTYSRGALLGVLVGGLVLIVIKASRAQILVVCLALSLLMPIGYAYSGKLVSVVARGQGVENLEQLSDRVGVWLAAIKMIQEHPLVGYGFVAGSKKYLSDYAGADWWLPSHAHNEFLEASIAGGIVAGIALVVFYAHALFIAGKQCRSGSVASTFLFVTTLRLVIWALQAYLLSNSVAAAGIITLVTTVVVRGAIYADGHCRTTTA